MYSPDNSERSQDRFGQGTETLMHELGNGLAAIGDFSNAQMPEWSRTKDRELPLFSLSSIEIATDHFSAANKIGRGGFGPVYKVPKKYYKVCNSCTIYVIVLTFTQNQILQIIIILIV